jgi:hypothetical protein
MEDFVKKLLILGGLVVGLSFSAAQAIGDDGVDAGVEVESLDQQVHNLERLLQAKKAALVAAKIARDTSWQTRLRNVLSKRDSIDWGARLFAAVIAVGVYHASPATMGAYLFVQLMLTPFRLVANEALVAGYDLI